MPAPRGRREAGQQRQTGLDGGRRRPSPSRDAAGQAPQSGGGYGPGQVGGEEAGVLDGTPDGGPHHRVLYPGLAGEGVELGVLGRRRDDGGQRHGQDQHHQEEGAGRSRRHPGDYGTATGRHQGGGRRHAPGDEGGGRGAAQGSDRSQAHGRGADHQTGLQDGPGAPVPPAAAAHAQEGVASETGGGETGDGGGRDEAGAVHEGHRPHHDEPGGQHPPRPAGGAGQVGPQRHQHQAGGSGEHRQQFGGEHQLGRGLGHG
jgi:hypothetical protein